MPRKRPLIVFILGPTGVGKSDIAVKIAKKTSGEIISCDSMQVYRGMPVISQQPPADLQKAIPHHLIGILDPSKEWSAADFVDEAYSVASDIVRYNKVPVVVGGTGLYARAFIKGLFDSPPRDDKLRRSLYEQAEQKGGKRLYEKLRRIDPVYAGKIHQNDLRRIIRALEVYELTGKPISEKQKESRGIESEYKVLMFILERDRNELYRRIDERVEKMFEGGIIREAKRLKARNMSRTARTALGYREISDYIKGRCSLQEAKEFLKKHTRQYAKRQLTWFRREESARWLDITTKNLERESIAIIVNTIRRHRRLKIRG